MRILNAEEVAHLAEAIDPQYSALVYASAYTGCRFGELAGLKLEYLDLGRRHLTVAEALSDVDGNLALTPSPAPRQLALPRFLVEESKTPILPRRAGSTLTICRRLRAFWPRERLPTPLPIN